MNTSGSPALPVGRAHAPRLADVVADQIRELILLGELDDGQRLPTLDKLVEQFGVSAPTMREALRILEAEGLIAVQRGGIGGALVRRPTPNAAAYTIALVLRSQGTKKRDVAEANANLEPLCAEMCARRPDRKTHVVPELRALNEAARQLVDGDDGVAFNEKMLQFHRAVVRLCGNDTLTLVTRALEDIWLADVHSWVASSAAHGEYPTAKERIAEVDAHDRIIELIERGDDAGVADAMAAHIKDSVYTSVVDTDERVDPKAVRLSRRS